MASILLVGPGAIVATLEDSIVDDIVGRARGGELHGRRPSPGAALGVRRPRGLVPVLRGRGLVRAALLRLSDLIGVSIFDQVKVVNARLSFRKRDYSSKMRE